ncbi:EF-hand domain-containing protein [Sphingomonas sanguinis]|uniref:Calcium-binding protein n=1 Tax=Sphingomonas sanguinis TaxID=33051 RepID=A0A147HRX7_9SPHN|nr:EF-hand domain-containing protein [Sphingomonas sanguinis]KTT66105.1 calcium-binding protein [Sphingomonas sanguinis]
MMKYAFLGAAMMVSAPVLAQVAPAPAQTTSAAPQAAPATSADPAQTAQPATSTEAAPAGGQVQATGSQIAQVVDTQFPTYDKDGDGKLNKAEFAQWMVALKSQTDPSTKAEAPATKKWVGSAFAQADTDKDKTVSKTELTGFLSQGQG